jgi:hypothetical protein
VTKKKGGPKRTRAARSLGASLRKKRAAIRELGKANVRRGPIELGVTRWLTPTRQGFRALDSFLLERQRGSRKRDREAFTFEIETRARGPSGKIERLPVVRGGFPRLQEARRRKKRGETEAAAVRRITETEIKKAIFRAADASKDVRGNSDELKRRIHGKSASAVKAAVRKFKSDRALSFRVRVFYVQT